MKDRASEKPVGNWIPDTIVFDAQLQ